MLAVWRPSTIASAATQGPAITVEISPPPTLRPGSHATLRVEVKLGPGAARPLLLTPHVEGQAIEVVRGRLLRSDARDTGAATLVFDVPIRVLSPGTAVVHVELAAYICQQRCQLFNARARHVLNVTLE